MTDLLHGPGLTVKVSSWWNMSMDMDHFSALRWNGDGVVSVAGAQHLVADALPEVAAAWHAKVLAADAEAKAAREAQEALEVRKGKRVVVTAGRKVPKGTEGVVFWIGSGQWGTRVGFNTDDGETVWTALSNVEVAALVSA